MKSPLLLFAALLAAATLASCGEETLQETAPTPLPSGNPFGWKEAVLPIFAAKNCVGNGFCHSKAAYPFSGNLPLDSANFTPDQLYAMVITSGGKLQRQGSGREADVANPATSLLLTKPTNQVAHTGGKLFSVDGTEYVTILHWIQTGAQND